MNPSDKMNEKITDLVCRSLSDEDAARYRTLMAKPQDDLTEEERGFLLDKETSTLTRGFALITITEAKTGSPAGCSCNAGMSHHRQWCPLYGQDSGGDLLMKLLRGKI
jgi:hypothetical protein